MTERRRIFNAQWFIGLLIALAMGIAALSMLLSDKFGTQGSQLGAEFNYNISQLRETDPALIIYDEVQSPIETGLPFALKIAVDPSDNIYISSGNSISSFDSKGAKRPYTVITDNEITALQTTKDGLVYAGIGNSIEIFNEKGQLVKNWNTVESNAIISAIGISKDFVFLADCGNRTIHQYKLSGKKIMSFGDFLIPSPFFDMEISPDNKIQVVNPGRHRIETVSFYGNLETWWGEFSCIAPEGFCGCCNPVNIALLPNHAGFITCEKGITRVKAYDQNGKFLGFVAGAEQFKNHDTLISKSDYKLGHSGLDVAVDSTGRVLVLDPASAIVRIFEKKHK